MFPEYVCEVLIGTKYPTDMQQLNLFEGLQKHLAL